MPKRIQLRRAKGWKMPANTVKVDRSTAYGNPFVVGEDGTAARCVDLFAALMSGLVAISTKTPAAEQIKVRDAVAAARHRLRGKNLACWCSPGKPCHADILLKVFNASIVLEYKGEQHVLR